MRVGVEHVHAVVLRRHDDYIVRSPGDAHALHPERLGINGAIHRARKKLPKG